MELSSWSALAALAATLTAVLAAALSLPGRSRSSARPGDLGRAFAPGPIRRARAAATGTPVRILVPVLDSPGSSAAVRHLVGEFLRGERMEVHLLHVRTPLPAYVARWISGRDRAASHRAAAEPLLGPAAALLGQFHIRCRTHLELGDKARVIVDLARRLRADRIVLGAARDNSLTRFVEDSVIEKVIRLAPAPVDVVGGNSVSRLERFGVPLGLGAALGLLWLRLGD
ncbi:MAG: universal stress protein [Burkholderiales bacterium]